VTVVVYPRLHGIYTSSNDFTYPLSTYVKHRDRGNAQLGWIVRVDVDTSSQVFLWGKVESAVVSDTYGASMK